MESGMIRKCNRYTTVLKICLTLMQCLTGRESTNDLNNRSGRQYIGNKIK